MADLAHRLPAAGAGAVYYPSHRYEQWIPKEEVTVMATTEARDLTITERLAEIVGCQGGCRKALESLVGPPPEGQGEVRKEPENTVDRVSELIAGIEYSMAEISAQINRLSGRLE